MKFPWIPARADTFRTQVDIPTYTPAAGNWNTYSTWALLFPGYWVSITEVLSFLTVRYTVKKAIGVLNFRRVILVPVMERSISWVKNIFPSPSAFLFITDDTKIYLYSTDEQKSIIYVRKQIPSSLMKNVEIVSEYFDVEVKECQKIPHNVAKFRSTSWKCAVSPFSHKMALNNLFYGLEFIQILKEIRY